MTVLAELKRQSDARFLAIYEALAQKGFGPLDAEVAKALKFRPQAIRKLPLETRARQARRILSSRASPELCYELFGTYLVRTRKELVTGFLDATGVPHAEGMIEDAEEKRPAAEKIPGAVAALDLQFAAEDVTLYLALCAQTWPDCEVFARLWRERAGQGVTP
ncbi:MAG: hypothetical protein AB1726_05305 [Planctomycetota bacterium]